jgi:ribosome-interacting GTPase 1
MCDVVEEYIEKMLRESYIHSAEILLTNGVSIEVIADSMPSLTYEDVVNISKQISKGGI